MNYKHTNREQLKQVLGKRNANRLEWKIDEVCKLAEVLKIHLVIDYEPKDSSIKVVVNRDPEIDFDNNN